MELLELFEILGKRKWQLLGIIVATVLFSMMVSLLMPPMYETQVFLNVRQDPLAEILTAYGDPKKIGVNKTKTKDEPLIIFQEYLASKEYKQTFYQDYFKQYPKEQPEKQKMFFYASSEPKTPQLIDLGFQSSNPKVSQQMAALFIKSIKDNYTNRLKEERRDLYQMIDKQITETKQRLNNIDKTIPDKIRKFKYIKLEEYIKDQEAVLNSLIDENLKRSYSINNNPIIVKLKQRVSMLEQLYQKEKDAAEKKELRETLAAAKAKLKNLEYLISSRSVSTEHLGGYGSAIYKIRSELNYLKKYDRDINIKIDSLKATTAQLDQLINIKNQLKLETLMKNINIKEIKGPVFKEKPINKRPKKNLAISLVLGLLLGLTTIIAYEYAGAERLRSADLEKLVAYFWGIIRPAKQKITSYSMDADAEQYNIVRTHLLFDVKEEKKAFSVIDLAQDSAKNIIPRLTLALARVGYKSLIIDADFRDGFTAKKKKHFEHEDSYGLKALISGGVPLDKYKSLLNDSETSPHISLLQTGGFAESPADLIAAKNFKLLLEKASKDFDYIFVLTPYSEKTADSLIVAKDVSNILYLIDPFKKSKLAFLKIFNQHKKFNKNKAGVIFYE